jgi:uncharacterized membrane protein
MATFILLILISLFLAIIITALLFFGYILILTLCDIHDAQKELDNYNDSLNS